MKGNIILKEGRGKGKKGRGNIVLKEGKGRKERKGKMISV